jgi:hypothetical protein
VKPRTVKTQTVKTQTVKTRPVKTRPVWMARTRFPKKKVAAMTDH